MRLTTLTIGAVLAGWAAYGGFNHFHQGGGDGATIPVWIATHDVAPGAAVDASDVREQDEPADVAKLGLRATSPIGQKLVFAHAVHGGDMLRDDDVVAATATSVVPITFKKAAGVEQGEYIDIYVGTTGSTATPSGGIVGLLGQQLIGRRVLVVSGGLDAQIAVPSVLEPFWTAIAASDKPLYADASLGVGVPPGSQVYSSDSAISVLSCVAAAPAGSATTCAGALSTAGSPQSAVTSGG